MKSILFQLCVERDNFNANINDVISSASRIGFTISNTSLPNPRFDGELQKLMPKGKRPVKYMVEHLSTVGWEHFGCITDAGYFSITLEVSTSHHEPRNEYEQFLTFLYCQLFRIFVEEFNAYKAILILQAKRYEYTLWLLGSGKNLIEYYHLETKPDDEPYLFTGWLSDPDKVQVSRDDVFTPRPAVVSPADYHNQEIEPSLPIAFDESLQSLVLCYSGGRALIRNNLINGKAIPIPTVTNAQFMKPDNIERHEANMTAATLHSIDDITARFGPPDYELPSTKWEPVEERGKSIIRQFVYNGLSERHVYLFRCWQGGLITLMLLGKERMSNGTIEQ